MEKDPNGIGGAVSIMNSIITTLEDDSVAESFNIDDNELTYQSIKRLMAFKFGGQRDILMKCEEAITRIGVLDFSMPVEIDDAPHVANYVAHSLNILMEELNARVFPFQDEIIDSISDLVFVTNQRGLVQRFNKSFSDLTGYKEDDVIGKSFSQLFPSIDLVPGMSVKDIDAEIIGKDGVVPVALSIKEVKGFRNLSQGFIFIAKRK